MLDRVSKNKQVTIATLRVSRQAQKTDPSNQTASLEQFWIARGIAVDEWICGLNFKRPKFSDLVDRIVRSELSTLMIARFGYELWSHLFENHGCQIVVLNPESLSPEQELEQDLMMIVYCFSSRLNGLRNYRKAIQKAMTNDQGTQDPAQSIA